MPTSLIVVPRVPSYFLAESEFVLFVVDPSNNYGAYFMRVGCDIFSDIFYHSTLPLYHFALCYRTALK